MGTYTVQNCTEQMAGASKAKNHLKDNGTEGGGGRLLYLLTRKQRRQVICQTCVQVSRTEMICRNLHQGRPGCLSCPETSGSNQVTNCFSCLLIYFVYKEHLHPLCPGSHCTTISPFHSPHLRGVADALSDLRTNMPRESPARLESLAAPPARLQGSRRRGSSCHSLPLSPVLVCGPLARLPDGQTEAHRG